MEGCRVRRVEIRRGCCGRPDELDRCTVVRTESADQDHRAAIEGLQHRDSHEGRSFGANDRKQNSKKDIDIPLKACSLDHSF